MLTHLTRALTLTILASAIVALPPAPVSAQVTPQWSAPVEVADDTYVFSPEIGLSDDGTHAVAVWSDNTSLVSRAEPDPVSRTVLVG